MVLVGSHVAMICRNKRVAAWIEALYISLLLHISISYQLHKNMLDYELFYGHDMLSNLMVKDVFVSLIKHAFSIRIHC